jgi:hypothetical protein
VYTPPSAEIDIVTVPKSLRSSSLTNGLMLTSPALCHNRSFPDKSPVSIYSALKTISLMRLLGKMKFVYAANVEISYEVMRIWQAKSDHRIVISIYAWSYRKNNDSSRVAIKQQHGSNPAFEFKLLISFCGIQDLSQPSLTVAKAIEEQQIIMISDKNSYTSRIRLHQ